MSAEGKPRTEPSLLSRPLVHVARLVTWFPLATLVLGVTAAVAAIAVAQVRLKFHTNRADVLNPSAEYNRRWMEYADEFGDEEDVVVVVEGPSQEAVVPALDEIGAAVAREPRLFHAVLDKTDLTRIRSKGLHYLPLGDLLAIDGFLGPMEPVLRGDWSQLSMTRLMGSLAGVGAAGGSAAHVPPAAREMPAKFLEGFARALSGRGPYQSPWPEMTPPAALDELGSRYLLANNGRLGFVLLRFSQKDEGSFAQNTDAVDSLRKIIDLAKFQYPHVKIGLTGLPIMENDEMRVSESSMSVLTCLSLGSIFVVLLVGFGCLRHSLMATAVLLLGTIWTVGYTALVVGYLNILSIAFGSILMGLGINYGIYYVARYLQLCETSGSTREALLRTAASVGPSITISASTAACSFFMAGFTDFKGVAQLGVIAGGGILLCWLAAMTILPALIQLFDAKRFGQALPAPLDLYMGLRALYARPGLVLAGTAAATVLLLVLGMGRLWYDDNLLNLEPVGLESVALERKLLTETNQSAWFALSVAQDPAEALARKARFAALPSVERVEELASLFPESDTQKTETIRRIHQRLGNLPQQVPPLPVATPAELTRALAGLTQYLAAAGKDVPQARVLGQLPELLRQLSPQEFYRRLSDYQQNIAADLLERARALRSVADPEPPALADLPPSLATRFVGRHGRFLLKIYGKGDIWDTATNERFVREVRSIDAAATGNPLQVYEASRDMKRSYEQAALYALITIIFVLLFEFRNIHYPLLAMLPLAAGIFQMFGLMGILGISLNSANMIVLPLILGLGVENGIHIINDYRRRPDSYRRMSTATTTAVVINSLTTMVGFAALMIASHQGLQSLGRVLTIGMSCCLLSALVLPNLLTLWRNWSKEPLAGYDVVEEGLLAPEPREGTIPWPAEPGIAARRRADAAA